MYLRSLGTTFRDLALIAAAAGPTAGCWAECPNETGSSALIEPYDAELESLVEACLTSNRDLVQCAPLCIALIERDTGVVLYGPSWVVECAIDEPGSVVHWSYANDCGGAGRRPAGYAGSGRARGTLGAHFAEQTRLEAASVRAFVELARALASHGAPRLLVDACTRAAREEIVHAVACARLARRFGAEPVLERATSPSPAPSLEELARDNVVEGCVRESWGAMVATWQARAATDPAVRAAMSRIAPDEAGHATLSRAIDRWATRKLDPAAQARVSDACADAVAELEACVAERAAAEARPTAPTALERIAGLPEPAIAARLLAGLRAADCARA
ncbi:MAG: ferritin-like domain-containing protein [Deltaproteobacteria bacterium]|nr:ferritin-like domain-containing protein [Deltaproteobacteria bacterium]